MNQEQNNLNPINFNTQDNNTMSNNKPANNQSFNQSISVNRQPINQINVEQPKLQPMNAFESGNTNDQSFNSKSPQKNHLGVIIGMVVAVIAIVVAIVFGGKLLLNNNNDDVDEENNLSDNLENNTNVELIIDENQPRFIKCILVENDAVEGGIYTYEIIKPNWKRYTFLANSKSFEDEVECENQNVDFNNLNSKYSHKDEARFYHSFFNDETFMYESQFSFNISYSLDNNYSFLPTYLESLTDSLLYINLAGKPHIYGNEKGYWYLYNDPIENDSQNIYDIDVQIFHFIDDLGSRLDGEVFVYNDLWLSLNIEIYTEEGFEMASYILEDFKAGLKEEYDLDVSEMKIDMLTKK